MSKQILVKTAMIHTTDM